MNLVETVLGVFFLIVCSITDLKNKTIYRSICIAFLLACMLVKILLYQEGLKLVLLGITPGIFLYFLSIFTDEAIGKGDAWIFVIIGIVVGFINSVVLLILSLGCVVIFSIPLLIKHKNLKIKVPFSPFVLFSFVIFLVM